MLSTFSASFPPTTLAQLLWCSQALHTCSDEELQIELQQLTPGQPEHLLPLLRLLLHNTQGLQQQLTLGTPAEATAAPPYSLLSAREQEILALVAQGHTLSQIGKKLFISAATVNNHCARMREKLGLQGRNSLVVYALNTKSK